MGKRRRRAVRTLEAANNRTKTEGGVAYPAAAFAFVPDPTRPATWRARLWESLAARETPAQVGRAVTALESLPLEGRPAARRRIACAWRRTHPGAAGLPQALNEAMAGGRTFNEISELVEDAIEEQLGVDDSMGGVWIRDLTDAWAVYCVGYGDDLFQVDYSVDDAGTVTLGEPAPVEALTQYVTATESRQRVEGRLLEALPDDGDGGRVFGVRILAYGDSRNQRRYPEAVMRAAAPLYEGAKAYDHHRSEDELASSTIDGLVGSYRNVSASSEGLEAELHLLPSAQHAAEALDASLVAIGDGLPPLVGISHDVSALFRPVVEGGRRFQEATEIVSVFSADVVADPAAGGRPTRMVAGGISNNDPGRGGTMTLKQLLELLRAATAEKRTELLTEHAAVVEDAGYTADEVLTLAGPEPTVGDGGGGGGGGDGGGGTPTEPALVPAGAAEARVTRESITGRMLIREAVSAAGFDERLIDTITEQLPEQFTEADLTRQVSNVSSMRAALERAGLAPTVPDVKVTKESRQKAIEALDAMFDGDHSNGFRSFKQAFYAFHPEHRPRPFDSEDENRTILRESAGHMSYDSARRGQRASESLDSSSWDQVLGDSVTRRLLKVYKQPNLQTWRNIVSATPPVNDFRTQRLDRIGGYGLLPAVNEGAPYQNLTSPTDEEATYAVTKRGGLEDLTIEMIANDDLRAIQRIPDNLGLSAAMTLYRFVFDMLAGNITCTYDSTALFASGHANTDTASALAQSTLSAGRKKMRKQAAYGNSSDVLSIVPSVLLVPSDLEEIAFQLATSAVAIGVGAGTTAGANVTDIPNIHQGLDVITVDYWSDTNDWILVADPSMVDTIEIGFYQGRQDPELFVQNDPTVGSMFDADKLTWKIRHIYSGTVLDHRGFYRGQG